ncbi:hypothetical protein [Dethiobacter alkaliphilus]|uniref:hypothetical protein n=1 Tax=Dethiobacter alkaliphilus TaxID=427926 RepID=UPI00117EC72A|nr:hypothetical protein [Dethiobacter alkaliphilus]
MKLQGNIWTIIFGFFIGIYWFFITMSAFNLFEQPISSNLLKSAISSLGLLICVYSLGIAAEGWKKGLKYPFYVALAIIAAYLLGSFLDYLT